MLRASATVAVKIHAKIAICINKMADLLATFLSVSVRARVVVVVLVVISAAHK